MSKLETHELITCSLYKNMSTIYVKREFMYGTIPLIVPNEFVAEYILIPQLKSFKEYAKMKLPSSLFRDEYTSI